MGCLQGYRLTEQIHELTPNHMLSSRMSIACPEACEHGDPVQSAYLAIACICLGVRDCKGLYSLLKSIRLFY